jgi:hypothetical protein
MPYPHVIQFETLDGRRRGVVAGAETPSLIAILRGRVFSVARIARLRRRPTLSGTPT